MEKRMRGFAEAGVTDLNCRIVALGEGREEIKASAERTREFLAAVAPALRQLRRPRLAGRSATGPDRQDRRRPRCRPK